jgi:hypothetical protein
VSWRTPNTYRTVGVERGTATSSSTTAGTTSAQTYADHFIAIHLNEIGGGKTYAQLSAAAQAAPSDTKLAATVNTVFKGETLRGLLLNAYAFGTMATVAGIAAIGAYIAAALMLALSILGLLHARRVPDEQTAFAGKISAKPVLT